MNQRKYPTREQLDVVDWIEGNLKIRGRPFILDDYQRDIVMCDNSFRIINKARKTGITTLTAAEALFKCMNNAEFLGIIVSKDDRASKYVLSFVEQLIHSFPKQISDNIVIDESKTEISFLNGSRLISLPCNPNAIRGFDADYIWADEFAFFNESEKDNDILFIAAAIPCLSVKQGGITLISTPNGKKGQFFQMWYEEPSEFAKIKIHWTECRRLYGMIEKIKASLPQPKELWFRQEYENSFEANIQGFIEKELLMLSIDDKLVLELQ